MDFEDFVGVGFAAFEYGVEQVEVLGEVELGEVGGEVDVLELELDHGVDELVAVGQQLRKK